MKKELYQHQKEAVMAAMKALSEGETPYLSVSTGGGKSLILAHLADKAMKQGLRVLQTVPSKELCEQNYIEAFEYVNEPKNIGICCSKLNKFQTNKQCVIATYTSFLRRRAKSGKFDVMLIDEAHGVGYEPESSYRKIIRSLKRLNPDLKIIGVTATPVRMQSGRLEEKYLDNEPIFTKCAYETNVQDLIKQGVLSHVESISGDIQVNLEDVPIKGGDYDTEIAAVKFDEILPHAIPDLKLKIEAYEIKTILIFASNVANARRIMQEWDDDNIRLIYGEMSSVERVHIINWLKHGEGVRVIVNVNVLLVGFNFQKLDAVCFLRATKSLALYRQAVGRVLRAHEDKKIGYVIDYSGNIIEHGAIDSEIPVKGRKRRGESPKKICTLPGCGHVNRLSAKFCALCGGEFISVNDEGMYQMRSKAEILAAKREAAIEHYNISDVEWIKCYSKKDGTPMIKGKMYTTSYDGIPELVYELYLMLDHTGFAKEKSKRILMSMFKKPSDFYLLGATHINVDNILTLLQNNAGFFKTIKAITLEPGTGSKYKELKKISYF